MNKKRFILILRANDIDVSSLPEDKRDRSVFKDGFANVVYKYLLKNYGVSSENIAINIQDNAAVITIQWMPEEIDENFEAEFERSMCLLSECKLEDAMFILEDLAFRSPNDPNVLYNLGMCYSDLGYLDSAIHTLKRCVKIVPLYSNAYVALGVAYGWQGKQKEAVIQFRKGIELDKNNSYAYRNLASILGKNGDNFNALKYLKLAYDIDAFDPHTLYGLGLMYQILEDEVNATVFYKKLVKLGTPQELVDIAKDSLRNIAVRIVKEKGFRTDAMFYCLSALEKFEKMKKEDIQKIAFEIGIKGTEGIDINNSSKIYNLKSMQGDFSGLQLLSYMYVGFKIIVPEQNIGLDLSREYIAAKQMFGDNKANVWK